MDYLARLKSDRKLWSNTRNHCSTVVREKQKPSQKAQSLYKPGPGWYCCSHLTRISVQICPFLPRLPWSESLCFQFSAVGCRALKAHALPLHGAIKSCGHQQGFQNWVNLSSGTWQQGWQLISFLCCATSSCVTLAKSISLGLHLFFTSKRGTVVISYLTEILWR